MFIRILIVIFASIMEILRLAGTDKKLYELVAPLVMNPAVIRLNNNYPFKTSSRYIWYVALDNESVCGFVPLKPTTQGLCIDNYYIKGDEEKTIDMLLKKIAEDLTKSSVLTAIVHKRHVKKFKKNGFNTWLELKNYNKMDFIPADKND